MKINDIIEDYEVNIFLFKEEIKLKKLVNKYTSLKEFYN